MGIEVLKMENPACLLGCGASRVVPEIGIEPILCAFLCPTVPVFTGLPAPGGTRNPQRYQNFGNERWEYSSGGR